MSRTQASQGVDTIDVHRATSANSLSATPPEGQGWVELVLNPDQGIQHHWAGLVQVKLVGLHAWLR